MGSGDIVRICPDGRESADMDPRRRISVILLSALVLLAVVAESRAEVKWGPFRGQVVDLETGQPIEGAVALAMWWRIIPTPVHGIEEFYDAREAVTGPDGRFEIPRLAAAPWTLGVQPAQITVFAPGYVWQATLVTPPGGEEFVAPTVVQMRHLKTREELLKKSRGYRSGIPEEKMREFLKVIDIERAMLGLRPERKRQP